MNQNKNIKGVTIFIGGVFGVGKTTLSYNLSKTLGWKQRTSLGVITKTLMYLRQNDPLIRNLNKLGRDSDEFPLFLKQANKLCRITNFITEVARKDGLNYIIDGVQLLPESLSLDESSMYLYLKSPEKKDLYKRLKFSTTHPLRYKNISWLDVEKLQELDRFILKRIVLADNIYILDSTKSEELVLAESLAVVKNRFLA